MTTKALSGYKGFISHGGTLHGCRLIGHETCSQVQPTPNPWLFDLSPRY